MPPRIPLRIPSARGYCSASAAEAEIESSLSVRKLPAPLRSRRRLAASPLLPPEAVALSPAVQAHVERLTRDLKASPRDLRKESRSVLRASHAGAAASKKHKLERVGGAPRVAEVADYRNAATGLAGLVTQGPQAVASMTYVMAELRRCRPRFSPRSMLDFGAGSAPAVSAAGRVFRRNEGVRSPEDSSHGSTVAPTDDDVALAFDASNATGDEYGNDEYDNEHREFESIGRSHGDWKLRGESALQRVVLVDNSAAQRDLGLGMLGVDPAVAGTLNRAVASLRDVPGGRRSYDVVSASYALSDVVRDAMTVRADDLRDDEADERSDLSRNRREALAEKRLKRMVKDLWSRVAPGGVLVLVEHGTLAGFETILFARETVLQTGRVSNEVETSSVSSEETSPELANGKTEMPTDEESDFGGKSHEDDGQAAAAPKVVAPCLHSETCPLQGTATRSRVCRFIQRLDRPLFLRNTVRRPTGHEDTLFSYIVIERPDTSSADAKDMSGKNEEKEYWGRLIRHPLRRGKHVVLDACTSEGQLERRVSSKKNGTPGMYAIARKVRWGDVWTPPAPAAKPQVITF